MSDATTPVDQPSVDDPKPADPPAPRKTAEEQDPPDTVNLNAEVLASLAAMRAELAALQEARAQDQERIAELEAENANLSVLVDDDDADDEPAFKTVRVWTGGPMTPQEKIGAGHNGIRPRNDGAYYATSEEQVTLLKRALGKKFWTDDIPDGDPSAKCETCGWTCRSFRAMNFHLNSAHGRAQEGN